MNHAFLKNCCMFGLSALFGMLASCTQRIPDGEFNAREGGKIVKNLTFQNVSLNRRVDPSLLKPPTETYVLGPGDIMDIEIAEISGTLARVFVMPDGMVYYNLAGGVRAEGLTIEEFTKKLQQALKRDYTNPLLNVSLVEVRSRRYWILGRVYKPGIYPLSQPTTLLEAIADSGGLFSSSFSGTTEELADLANSVVIRNGDILPVDFSALINGGDTSQDIYLHHNDFIFLPSSTSSTVLLLGAVKSPQAIAYRDKLTLLETIASGNGLTPKAQVNEVVIVRGSLQKPTAAIVNFRNILNGKDTDVLLQPKDIVWVPEQPLGYLEATVKMIFRDSARALGSREGARLVGSDQGSPITIPGGVSSP